MKYQELFYTNIQTPRVTPLRRLLGVRPGANPSAVKGFLALLPSHPPLPPAYVVAETEPPEHDDHRRQEISQGEATHKISRRSNTLPYGRLLCISGEHELDSPLLQ